MQLPTYSKILGTVSLWRYTENERNYPGWQLSADASGAASLCSLVTELKVVGGYRTVTVTPPSEALLRVPNNKRGKAAWWAPVRLRVQFLSAPEEANSWRMIEDADTVVLSLGSESMSVLLAGIEGIGEGKGDYSIGTPSLWFWWWRE